jgi:dGTP triphosphohydrolase
MSFDTAKLNEILAKFAIIDEMEKTISFLSKKYDDLNSDFVELKSVHEKLDKENKSLKAQVFQSTRDIKQLKYEVNDLEQYSRRDCLEIRGVPYLSEEDTNEIVKNVGELVDVDLEEDDFSVSHRLGDNSTRSDTVKRDPAIIVKFVRRSNRDELYKARKKLMNKSSRSLGFMRQNEQSIYISESLTKLNRKIFNQCLQKKKDLGFKYIWTSYGKTLLRKDGDSPVISIRSEDDLGKLSRIT